MRSETCEKLYDYFSGSLSEIEAKKFEAHLETCADCQEELKELEALTSDLPYLSEPVEPPAGMKERVLHNVLNSSNQQTEHPERVTDSRSKESVSMDAPNRDLPIRKDRNLQKRTQTLKYWVIGLAACLVLSLAVNIFNISGRSASDQNQQKAKVMFSVPLSPTPKGTAQMKATAAMIKSDGEATLIIEGKHLKPISGDQVYQVWLLKDGKPVPAGSFKPGTDGSGAIAYKMNQTKIKNWDAVAISVESAPNHQTPQGTIYMQAKL